MDNDKDYQGPGNWIDDERSPREPLRSPRAVVSVAFSREISQWLPMPLAVVD